MPQDHHFNGRESQNTFLRKLKDISSSINYQILQQNEKLHHIARKVFLDPFDFKFRVIQANPRDDVYTNWIQNIPDIMLNYYNCYSNLINRLIERDRIKNEKLEEKKQEKKQEQQQQTKFKKRFSKTRIPIENKKAQDIWKIPIKTSSVTSFSETHLPKENEEKEQKNIIIPRKSRFMSLFESIALKKQEQKQEQEQKQDEEKMRGGRYNLKRKLKTKKRKLKTKKRKLRMTKKQKIRFKMKQTYNKK
jgi:hypothetical protein